MPVKEMTPTSARIRVNRSFRVQGQGFQKQDYDQDPDSAGAASSGFSTSIMSMASGYDMESGGGGSGGAGNHNPAMVEELVSINRTLEQQIDTLRMRLDFDKKHHEEQKTTILAETGAKLKSKLEEVNKLQNQLHSKDIKLLELTEKNHKRDSEVSQLKRHIETLKEDVNSAKTFANELVDELSVLTRERERLRGEGVLGDKDVEITALRNEVGTLKTNLSTLDGELKKAREVMKTQADNITFHEADKKTIQLKFKEELAKVTYSMRLEVEKMRVVMRCQWEEMRSLREQNTAMSQDIEDIHSKVTYSMRLEVEKMRDVMRCQWEEMRTLREQNTAMSQDIKDIRSLLMNGCLDDDAKAQQEEDAQGQGQSHGQGQTFQPQGQVVHQETLEALPVPQTARGSKTVYNQFNMGAMKPSLPLLNKEIKKSRQKLSRSAMK